jgi:molecular chaperone HscA
MLFDVQDQDRVQYCSITEAVGIDFGTTFCGIALCTSSDSAKLIGPLIPSIVAYRNDTVFIGHEAKGDGEIRSIKRWLDHQAYEPQNDERFDGRSAFQVAVDLFLGLKDHMMVHLGRWIPDAIVTVPAYFDESRRQVIKHAASTAGWNVLRLLSEPTAAALCHKVEKEGFYGVYDLGGGTFDFSIVTMRQGLFRVLGTGGHATLGGDDVDCALGHVWFPHDPLGEDKARVIKESGRDLSSVTGNDQWKKVIDPLIEATLSVCQETVDQAGISLDQLHDVFLVGGSTHSVFVKEKITDFLGRQPSTLLNPETAVACGAAIYAYNLIHQSSFLLLDVTPLSLGIETFGGIVEKLIVRNTPLPAEKHMIFTTQIDGQTSIKIHVLQGEREMVSGCQSLGTFDLTGIPPLPKGEAKIKITLSLDIDGLLTVQAEEISGAIKQSVCINATRDVTYAQIEKELAHSGEDILERILVQKSQQAQDALNEVRRVLHVQPDAVVHQACVPLEQAIASKDLTLLQNEWEIFSGIALPFLESYMTYLLKNNDIRVPQSAPYVPTHILETEATTQDISAKSESNNPSVMKSVIS